MHRRRGLALLLLLILPMLGAAPAAAHQAEAAVVRGVLFFSPTCPHCEYVIQEYLPGLYEEHGGPWEVRYDETVPAPEVAYYLLTNGTIELLLVDVTVEEGSVFFEAATDALSIGSTGVPRLVVSNQVMIGSTGIPDRFPVLVEEGLAAGGIDWPDLPGIGTIVDSFPATPPATTATTSPATTTAGTSTTTTAVTSGTLPITLDEAPERSFGDDAVANSIAVVVLVALLASLGWAAGMLRQSRLPYRPTGLVPLLVVAGLVIAGYLTYIEIGDVAAVCGPVGDCNAVQQSEYAMVAGIPIGVMGLAGYLAIGLLWALQRRAADRRGDLARVGVTLVAVTGALFSAWLTFLEPFVIHATCAWCVGSAVVIGCLVWLTVPGGVEAWRRLAPVSDPE